MSSRSERRLVGGEALLTWRLEMAMMPGPLKLTFDVISSNMESRVKRGLARMRDVQAHDP